MFFSGCVYQRGMKAYDQMCEIRLWKSVFVNVLNHFQTNVFEKTNPAYHIMKYE